MRKKLFVKIFIVSLLLLLPLTSCNTNTILHHSQKKEEVTDVVSTTSSESIESEVESFVGKTYTFTEENKSAELTFIDDTHYEIKLSIDENSINAKGLYTYDESKNEITLTNIDGELLTVKLDLVNNTFSEVEPIVEDLPVEDESNAWDLFIDAIGEENYDIIVSIFDFIVGVVSTILGVFILTSKIRKSISALNDEKLNSTETIKELKKQFANSSELIKNSVTENEKLKKEVEDKNNQILSMKDDISSMKECIKLAYCNDSKLVSNGKADEIAKTLEGGVNNGKETTN